MSRILRRAAVVALAAAAAGGLATATPAEAASAGYTQLEICHTGATDLNIYIVGYNQVGDWVKSYTAKIPPYSCYWMSNWWWQTDRAFELHWEVANSVTNWHWNPVYIPGTAADGGWQQATIYE
jgi:hypothetical protein